MIPQNHLPTSLDEKSVHDILIKLPIKSLMRFKCVSKRWQSLIQDPSFVKSHLSGSKKHPQLLINTFDNDASKIILTPEDGFNGGVALQKVKIPWAKKASMLDQSIDGLFCYVNYSYALTCIYNLGTQQVTPWAQSCIPIQGNESVKHKAIYGFGFDPLTNSYKVFRNWEITRQGYEDMGRVEHICEVFTVGENRWRKINEVPPGRLESYSSVYANGSIYWRNDVNGFTPPDDEQQDNKVVVAFDVGTERFRVIEVPNFILGVCREEDDECYIEPTKKLLQIDGHLALIDRVGVQYVKFWVSDDDPYNKEMTTNWTEETISLSSPLKSARHLYFYPVEGTDEIVIDTYPPANRGRRGSVSLYVYNRTRKSFRSIDITGIPPLHTDKCKYYIFHESLVPIEEETLDQHITALALV